MGGLFTDKSNRERATICGCPKRQILKMTSELTYPELISEIRRLSSEKQNGTIFITSTTGHLARIVLNQGIITYLIFDGSHKGLEAIAYIQAIKLARLQFVGGSFENYQASTLPSTDEILALLSSAKKMTEEKVNLPTATEITPKTTTKSSDLSNSNDLNEAIEYIKNMLADYIGPIANVICDDYLQQIKPHNTKNDLTVMIATLAFEIENPDEQEKFKSNLRKKLFPETN